MPFFFFTNTPPTEIYTLSLHDALPISKDRAFAAIVDGANADDRGDYRPGRQAAREFGVRSPLDECDLTKADIRDRKSTRLNSSHVSISYAVFCLKKKKKKKRYRWD